jgi:hypothetical protein
MNHLNTLGNASVRRLGKLSFVTGVNGECPKNAEHIAFPVIKSLPPSSPSSSRASELHGIRSEHLLAFVSVFYLILERWEVFPWTEISA